MTSGAGTSGASAPPRRRLLLASRNRGKLVELRRILDAALGQQTIELVGLDDVPAYQELPETGLTFAENALDKAREGARQTGLATVADDSGLAVEALNGMPGVFSARWSGRHGDDDANLRLLLNQLGDVPDEHLAAGFVCAAALVAPDTGEHVVEGRVDGVLVRAPRGEHGFGYDPIFVPAGETLTTAELSPERKDQISHRGQAFRALAKVIAAEL
ncbi:MAG: RdgB/HAM1 family non-canonical purine NTP pyrophosphatase [Micromonosporaceae bacterium]